MLTKNQIKQLMSSVGISNLRYAGKARTFYYGAPKGIFRKFAKAISMDDLQEVLTTTPQKYWSLILTE